MTVDGLVMKWHAHGSPRL